MSRRFCANCGAEETPGNPVIDGLCTRCYVALKDVVRIPKSIGITACTRCGALHISGRWLYPTSAEEAQELVRKFIASMVKPGEDASIDRVDVELLSPDFSKARISVRILIKNRYRYSMDHVIGIRWSRKLCGACLKRAGKSFEAVVQLRFVRMEDSAREFLDSIEKAFADYIVEVEEVANGYDIRVVSPGIARKIADMARRTWRSSRVIESFGDTRRERDGSRHAKLYISVRVINPVVGDYIVVGGRAYTVVEVHGNRLVVVDSEGTRKSIPIDELLSLYKGSKAKHRR